MLKKHFALHEKILYYDDSICVPRSNVKNIIEMAYDDPAPGHFEYAKKLAR